MVFSQNANHRDRRCTAVAVAVLRSGEQKVSKLRPRKKMRHCRERSIASVVRDQVLGLTVMLQVYR